MKRSSLIKTCLLSAAMLFSIVTFSQQGGQMNPGNKVTPANKGVQNQPGQSVQNPANARTDSLSGQMSRNDDFKPELQAGETYPADQNLQYNEKSFLNTVNSQLSQDVQKNQPPSGQGSQALPDTRNTQSLPAQNKQNNSGLKSNTNKNPVNARNPGDSVQTKQNP